MKKIKVELTYPDTLEKMRMLQDKIDTAYASIIMNKINTLGCDVETKKQYLAQVTKELKDWKQASTLDEYLATQDKEKTT